MQKTDQLNALINDNLRFKNEITDKNEEIEAL